MEDDIIKKSGRTKRFFKRLGVAAILTAGYGLFYSQVDTDLIKGLSQKKGFIIGIDFEAYNKTETLGIDIQRKGEKETQKEGEEVTAVRDKKIENWTYISEYTITSWMEGTYANTLGFTPYYGKMYDKEKLGELLEEGDETLKDIINYTDKSNLIILKVRDENKDYEYLLENDPLTFVTQRIARNVSDKDKRVIIDLGAPDDGDYEAHNKRIAFIKKLNPELKVATTLDKNEGYDEKTGLWDPKKSKEYWKNADIIIIEDYSSKPSNLEKSIKSFKNATLGKKQIWVRVIVGTERINERGIKSLEAEVEEYEKIMEVVKEHADGCLANDSNGIWLYSSEAYDKQERLNRTKQLYKKFREIKTQ